MSPALKRSLGAGGLALAALAPFLLADYRLHLLIMAGIFAILALSLNVIVGYVGQLSLGHARSTRQGRTPHPCWRSSSRCPATSVFPRRP